MKKRPSTSSSSSTVVEALARAEAWAERAALLTHLSYEVTDIFDASNGREPRYLLPRLLGGATAANPRNVEDLRDELFMAAEEARAEMRAIMASAAAVPVDGSVPALHGDGEIAAAVHEKVLKLPRAGDDDVVANPRCPRGRSGRDASTEPESEEEVRATVQRILANQREGRFG